jgi:hypothetical protein
MKRKATAFTRRSVASFYIRLIRVCSSEFHAIILATGPRTCRYDNAPK